MNEVENQAQLILSENSISGIDPMTIYLIVTIIIDIFKALKACNNTSSDTYDTLQNLRTLHKLRLKAIIRNHITNGLTITDLYNATLNRAKNITLEETERIYGSI